MRVSVAITVKAEARPRRKLRSRSRGTWFETEARPRQRVAEAEPRLRQAKNCLEASQLPRRLHHSIHIPQKTTLCSASYVGCQRNPARICCRGLCYWPAIDRCLLRAGPQQQTRRRPLLVSIDGTGRRTDGRTDRRTLDRFIDYAPHTMRAATKTYRAGQKTGPQTHDRNSVKS